MKKWMILLLVPLIMMPLTVSRSHADPRHDQLIKGMIIGTGAALLGAALIQEIHHDGRNRLPARGYSGHPGRYPGEPHHRNKGPSPHEYRRGMGHYHGGPPHMGKNAFPFMTVWVPPLFDTQWVPGHVNRRGFWVKGHYKKNLVRKGYWDKRRVPHHPDR